MSRSKVYVKYNGFYDDGFWGRTVKEHKTMEDLIKEFVPNSKVFKFSRVSYLTQKGQGPGYFNNSAVYNITFKITADISEEEVKVLLKNRFAYSFDMKFFDTAEEFTLIQKEQQSYAKRMREINPF